MENEQNEVSRVKSEFEYQNILKSGTLFDPKYV